MTPEMVGLIGLIVLLLIMFCRFWVGPSMILVSFIGSLILTGWDPTTQIIGSVPYSQTANYTIACMPLFILMGTILSHSQIGADLYVAVRKWMGHIRGGLAIATIGACGLFAAICGESSATAITMGKIAFPEMRKYGYSLSLSSCSVVCGGTIGILIPPSVILIIYGMLTEESITHLFMAGVIPGILQVMLYMIVIYIMCRLKPDIGPAGPKENVREKFRSLKMVWPVVAVFIFIIGGLYGGLFTATEAGAMGASAALIITIIMRRMNKTVFSESVKDALQSTAMVFLLLIGAYIFMRFMALSNLPPMISEAVINFQQAHHLSPVLVIILIMFVYTILGCFLDSMAVLLLTVPIITPIVVTMGYDQVWWGIMMVRFIEMSMITPPFGLNLFIMTKAIDTPLSVLYQGVWPFLIADVVHVALLIAFPEIALWLPNSMKAA